MTIDKEKRKGKPRNHLYIGLAIIVLLIVVGFFAAPYAEDRLVAWLDDDPFTPKCDAGHLELAFVRENQLLSIRGDGTNLQFIGTVQYPQQPLSWSPDGKWLFYIQDAHTLWFHNVEDTDASFSYPLVQAIQGTQAIAIWSPDSSHLVFAYKINENFSQLMMFQMSDMSEHTDWFQSSQSVTLYDFEWSEDSQFLYYTYLESDENESKYHGYFWDLKSSLVELIRPWEAQIVGGQWSVDNRLAYMVNKSSIHIREQGGSITEFNLPESYIINFYWSPDGSQIAYWSGDTDYMVIIDSYTGKEIWRFTDFIEDWTERGMIVRNTEDNIFVLRVVHPETQTIGEVIAQERAFSKSRPFAQWSPDGNHILYTLIGHAYGGDSYYLISPNGENRQLVPTMGLLHDRMWTPDNHYLIYIGKNHWLYLLDLETYKPCRVLEEDENGFIHYDWRIISEEQK